MRWRFWRYVVGKKEIECHHCGETQVVWSIIGAAYWNVKHIKSGECEYHAVNVANGGETDGD